MVNITGHGWRKLMRAAEAFSYEIENIPKPPEEFILMQQFVGVDDSEMYGNFNMGAGFAIFVPADEADRVIRSAKAVGLNATLAGSVKSGDKKVHIKPLNLTFEGDTLGVRS